MNAHVPLVSDRQFHSALAAPLDVHTDGEGNILFRAFAKLLGCAEIELRTFLHYYRHKVGDTWLSRAQYKDRGFFEVKAYTASNGHSGVRMWFTPKGVAHLTRKFEKWQASHTQAREQDNFA